jgi:predicted heme/steroid binding protein
MTEPSFMNSLNGELGHIVISYLNNGQVYEALSSKNWGASTTLMNDIAGETGD